MARHQIQNANPWTPEEAETVRRLYAEYRTLAEIGRVLGRTRSAVRGFVERCKLTRPKRPDVPLTEAQLALVEKWSGLPGWAVKRWPGWARRLGQEEVYAIATLALCVAAQRFDPLLGAFGAFAQKSIGMTIRTEIDRGGLVRNKSAGNGTPSVKYEVFCFGAAFSDRSDHVPTYADRPSIDNADEARAMLEAVPAAYRRVAWDYHAMGRDMKEIAADLGVSRARVWQILQKIDRVFDVLRAVRGAA